MFPQHSSVVGGQLSLIDVITIEVYSRQGCLNGVLEELAPVLVLENCSSEVLTKRGNKSAVVSTTWFHHG